MKDRASMNIPCMSRICPTAAARCGERSRLAICLAMCVVVLLYSSCPSHFGPLALAQVTWDASPEFGMNRKPIPSASQLAKTAEAIEALFGDKATAAKTPKSASRLAEDVLVTRESAETDAEYYGLCMYAITLAGKGDDPTLVIAIAKDTAERFRVDAASLALPRLSVVTGAGEPESRRAAAKTLNTWALEKVKTDDYETAEKLIAALAVLGKRARDRRMLAQSTALRKTLVEARRAHQKLVTLRSLANDPSATAKTHQELGVLLCFQRGEWEAGLPHLARGEDADLSAAARGDLAATTPGQRREVAADWARVAATQPYPANNTIRARAVAIYESLAAHATGLQRAQLQKEIDSLTDQSATADLALPNAKKWFVLFRSRDPAIWNTDTRRGNNDFALPVTAAPEGMRFLRLAIPGKSVIIPLAKGQLPLDADLGPYIWAGSNRQIGSSRGLGIALRKIIDCRGLLAGIAIRNPGSAQAQTGYGFGGRIGRDNRQGFAWNGQEIECPICEISVSTGPLDSKEQESLLPVSP